MNLFNTIKTIFDSRKDGSWYRINNKVDVPKAEIYLYNDIGMWEITADQFVADLVALDVDEIDLRINSKGGEIFDGVAIYEALKSHRAYVTTYVDSVAASIASVVAMAGDKIKMGRNSEMMMHNAQGITIGDDEAHEQATEVLKRQNRKIAGIYADRAGNTPEHWMKLMRATTWFSAQEAVDEGLADEVISLPDGQKNSIVGTIFNLRYPDRSKAPEPLKASVNKPQVEDDDWAVDLDVFYGRKGDGK